MPALGSRVIIRYRLPADSPKPMTDVIGYLESSAPQLRVRTKTGDVVAVAPADVVTVRELSAVPVRTSDIRALEYAAALAWPGTEHHWHEGWLLRAANGFTNRGNSAVPLEFSAIIAELPAIIDWYTERGLPARVAVPERLLSIRAAGETPIKVMTTYLDSRDPENPAALLDKPDHDWLMTYDRHIPVDVLTAVVDGEVVFASIPGAAIGRGAVTSAPDGTRWLGISAVNTVAAQRRNGFARSVCATLTAWGARHGATRAYVHVAVDNAAAVSLYESLNFRLHHHYRYFDAGSLITRTL